MCYSSRVNLIKKFQVNLHYLSWEKLVGYSGYCCSQTCCGAGLAALDNILFEEVCQTDAFGDQTSDCKWVVVKLKYFKGMINQYH